MTQQELEQKMRDTLSRRIDEHEADPRGFTAAEAEVLTRAVIALRQESPLGSYVASPLGAELLAVQDATGPRLDALAAEVKELRDRMVFLGLSTGERAGDR